MKYILPLIISFVAALNTKAQDDVYIEVNANRVHQVGEITSFDRNKFVTIHADITENEWNGDNFTSDLRDNFLNGYDVYLGRNTGLITWQLNANMDEDPNNPGFVKPSSVASYGEKNRISFENNAIYKSYEDRNDQILCAQLHPFYPDGQETNKGWAFSQTDSDVEPFGTATGNYMSLFMKEFYSNGKNEGQRKPQYLEVINEPLWHLVDHGEDVPETIFRFHNAVANEVRKNNPDVKLGGFCTAFPDVEKNGFQQWEERWKLFMDIAGKNMDYWTIHLYDFPSINGGEQRYRKGSQMEATFDMMEQYSFLSFGEVKPFMISEFGAQMHDYNKVWSPYRDWLHIKSCNAMMLQFMERPNLINKTINFIPIKAEWGYNSESGVVYNHRLMRKENEPENYTGEWVYSDMIKLYELWKNVNGTRVDSKSTNVDILCDSYVEDNKLYLIVNNLNLEKAVKIHPYVICEDQNIASLQVKHLYCSNQAPKLEEQEFASIPVSLTLAEEGTMVLEYTFNSNVATTDLLKEEKTYAAEYYKEISAGTPMLFQLNEISLGVNGEAMVRIGVGRSHGKELFPEIKINNKIVSYEHNYRGDDQAQRSSFFGVLEVPVEYGVLMKNNEISITFPDSGGCVSSVALQNYISTSPLNRFKDITTSSQNLQQGKVNVFPNPCTDYFRCNLGNNEVMEGFQLFNSEGKICKSKSGENNVGEFTIPVSNLIAGVYVLRIQTSTSVSHSQVIIK